MVLKRASLLAPILLHNIKEKYGNNLGLYRNDGLEISNASPRQVEIIKKDLCKDIPPQWVAVVLVIN